MANIDLITGFLGAGKTTFIRKYIKFLHNRGERVAVIENEYGSKGIDSVILRAEGVETSELFGGCICCTLKVGFHDMLLRLSESFDRVVVEPSGVYDISQFYSVMASPELREKCSAGNVICIVDPFTLNDLDDFSKEMLAKQIRASGCTLFSMDDSADREAVDRYVEKTASLLDIPHFKSLCYNDFDSIAHSGISDYHADFDDSHSARYLSTLISPLCCTEEEMHERLEKLFSSSECGTILRVKGIWNSKMINCVNGRFDISDISGEDGVNVIGLSLDRRAIRQILNNEG